MHHPIERIVHTTAFVIPVVEHWLEQEIVQWVHSMKDRSDDPSHHERTLLPRSYTSLRLIVKDENRSCHFIGYFVQLAATDLLYTSSHRSCSSVDSVPAFEAVGRRIDPSQWTQLQFGLFSVPTSGPQLVYQRPWYVLFCLWKSAYKRSLAAYRKE